MTIVGARPQFVKAAMVSRALADFSIFESRPLIEELVHTGQHYDDLMSQVFFKQLSLPNPVVMMELGGGTHGQMTGRMLPSLEREMIDRHPDLVLVYGDTNSTLAGALAAAKLNIPIAHVEAGLRSFNKSMPEEINRVLTDHLSSLFFCPTSVAVQNLKNEGLTESVYLSGDVMYDAALFFRKPALADSLILKRLGLKDKDFLLVTVHRQENIDNPERLGYILTALERLGAKGEILVWPLHPRLKTRLKSGIKANGLFTIEPLPFLDMIRLEIGARVILTDSGGVQKEAYFHRTPCVTLRKETEWIETVVAGWNQLVDCDPERIEQAVAKAEPGCVIAEYGTGNSSKEIARILASC